MTRQVIILDGELEYDLVVEDNKCSFMYSNSEKWYEHIRGTKTFSLEDDGNGFKFKSGEKNRLDYSEAFLLYVALRLKYEHYNIEIAEIKNL